MFADEEHSLVAPYCLRHDAEQLRYLLSAGVLQGEGAVTLAGRHAEVLERATQRLTRTVDDMAPQPLGLTPVQQQLGSTLTQALAQVFRRVTHVPRPDINWEATLGLKGSAFEAAPHALNPALDFAAMEREYEAGGVVVRDDFLTTAALRDLKRFVLEATGVFTTPQRGYLGAYQEKGFAPFVIARLAEELEAKLPTVMAEQFLSQTWAYKYDERVNAKGINIHADEAAVNFNFWVTDDNANLDKEHGGLVVYTKMPPPSAQYESTQFSLMTPDEQKAWRAEIEAGGKLVVPNKQNRVVFFQSNLFHQSDVHTFRKGYKNRRINVTLLFGLRLQAAKATEDKEKDNTCT